MAGATPTRYTLPTSSPRTNRDIPAPPSSRRGRLTIQEPPILRVLMAESSALKPLWCRKNRRKHCSRTVNSAVLEQRNLRVQNRRIRRQVIKKTVRKRGYVSFPRYPEVGPGNRGNSAGHLSGDGRPGKSNPFTEFCGTDAGRIHRKDLVQQEHLLCSGPHYIEVARPYPYKSAHRNRDQMCMNVHMVFPKKKVRCV